MHKWMCVFCGREFVYDNDADFSYWGEEELWGHIQLHHEDVFEDVKNFETPFMLEECYDNIT